MPLPPLPNIGTDKPAHTPGALTEDEVEFIFLDKLRAVHRENPKVLKFIASYVRCRDIKQSSREAELDYRTGYALRDKPDVHACIEAITRKSAMKYGYDAHEVVERVKEIASVDPGELQRPDGSFIESLLELEPEVRRAIKKFEAKNLYEKDPNGMTVCVGKLLKVEFWDKMKAHELLGKEKKLFAEQKTVKHDVSDKMASILLEAKKNAAQAQLDFIDVTPRLGPGVKDGE